MPTQILYGLYDNIILKKMLVNTEIFQAGFQYNLVLVFDHQDPVHVTSSDHYGIPFFFILYMFHSNIEETKFKD
jgi:hypothetical protein